MKKTIKQLRKYQLQYHLFKKELFLNGKK